MRVLIVDDSAFMRKIISEMISSDPGFEVVGIARDGQDGIEKALELKPDLITLDIEMPIKDGLTALREIKVRCHDFKPSVLMCSSLTVNGSHEAFKAMRIGAADVIGKDPATVGKMDAGFKEELLGKLHAIGGHRQAMQSQHGTVTRKLKSTQVTRLRSTSGTGASGNDAAEKEIDFSRVKAVVVGSSTGGPPVLEEIFSKLESNLRVPIIVAQHMPELFTKSLAARLDQYCSCNTTLATKGTLLSQPGIYIAQGGSHIKPTRVAGGKMITRITDTIPGAIYRPSVDLLFSCAAELFGNGVLAIQLTGMGSDGVLGAQKIHKSGGQIIAQSADSCVVYGMPKAVVDGGFADRIMAPQEIKRQLMNLNGAVEKKFTPETSTKIESKRSA